LGLAAMSGKSSHKPIVKRERQPLKLRLLAPGKHLVTNIKRFATYIKRLFFHHDVHVALITSAILAIFGLAWTQLSGSESVQPDHSSDRKEPLSPPEQPSPEPLKPLEFVTWERPVHDSNGRYSSTVLCFVFRNPNAVPVTLSKVSFIVDQIEPSPPRGFGISSGKPDNLSKAVTLYIPTLCKETDVVGQSVKDLTINAHRSRVIPVHFLCDDDRAFDLQGRLQLETEPIAKSERIEVFAGKLDTTQHHLDETIRSLVAAHP
jgi:hypothetical protein